MSLGEMTLKAFSDEVAAVSPAPGGGSCSAYSTAIGCGLGSMMARLSFGKKSYEAKSDDEKTIIERTLERLDALRVDLVALVDEDTEAFNQVMEAFKLPKDTDEDKAKRRKAIDDATWISADVPLKTATLSLEAARLLEGIMDIGNPNSITDLGVGVLMAVTGVEGALLNVEVNLGSVVDQERAKKTQGLCKEMLEEAKAIRDRVLPNIHQRLAL